MACTVGFHRIRIIHAMYPSQFSKQERTMIVAKELDLSQASEQDVFDFVVMALIQQGHASVRSSSPTSCLYRETVTSDGAEGPGLGRCAAGHLIADSEYTPEMDQTDTIYSVLNTFKHVGIAKWANPSGLDTLGAGNTPRIRFLRSLQQAHDLAVNADGIATAWLAAFRIRARQVAKEYGLDPFLVGYRSGF
jgi:hypothetical protein